jgi:hypothetical protein
MSLQNPDIPHDWGLQMPDHPNGLKVNDMMGGHARRLVKLLRELPKDDKEARKKAVYAFYRKYYTLTLCKSCVAVGINNNPARDRILDFPWKDLDEHRITCRQLWEKINT